MPSQKHPGAVPLKQRVLRGGAWSVAGYGLAQAIRFGSNLVMTRLLVPDAFALMAIASVVMIGLAMFSDLGLKPVIVQSKRGNDPKFLNTAWIAQIVRGLILWFIALGISLIPLVADGAGVVPKNSVYADSRLPYVIITLSITAVIAGFNSTKLFEAGRRLALGRITVIEITAQIVGLGCMYGWVLVDRSISALVAGNIASALTTMLLSHTWLRGVSNRLEWDKSAFKEIFHFGKWIFMSSVLTFLVSNSDRLFLGGVIDKSVLGVYVIAVSIVSSVEAILLRIIGSVSFPALSEIARERPNALRAAYYQIHAVIAAFAYFCSGVLIMSGQSLIGLLYDSRYVQAGWMLEIVAVNLLATPFQIAIQGFMALGAPRLNSNILALRLLILFAALPLGFYFFGLPGALWGSVLSQLMCIPIIVLYSIRYGLFDPRQELRSLPMVLVGLGAGWIVALIIRNYFGT